LISICNFAIMGLQVAQERPSPSYSVRERLGLLWVWVTHLID
jgi:hypothetical protein